MEQSLPLEKSQSIFCVVLAQIYFLAGFYHKRSIYRAKTKYGNIVIKDLRRVTTQLLNHVNKCVMRTWPMLCVFFCEQFMALSNTEFSI